MSKENMEQFYQELSQNQEWQENLKKATDIETFTKLIAELGKEKGYTFTSEQVEVATTETIENEAASTDVWEELPDEQLEAVAGGFSGLGFEFSDYLYQMLWAKNPDGGAPDASVPQPKPKQPEPKWCATGMKKVTKVCG